MKLSGIFILSQGWIVYLEFRAGVCKKKPDVITSLIDAISEIECSFEEIVVDKDFAVPRKGVRHPYQVGSN